MRTTLLALSLMLSGQIFARGMTPIKSGDIAITQASVGIIDTKEICPAIPNMVHCLVFGSTVTLKIRLGGCMDRLGGYATHFEVVDGQGVLMVNAINIVNKASALTRCIQQPFETVDVYVPFSGEIILKEMNFSGQVSQMNLFPNRSTFIQH